MVIKMIDRELLELAAKAIDIHYDMYVEEAYIQGAVRTGLWNDLLEDCWNPLTDDGDALRLAVKCLPFYTLRYSREDWEKCGEDGYAATRRAIVLAAAEIGRGK